jgi:hypothetical protein
MTQTYHSMNLGMFATCTEIYDEDGNYKVSTNDDQLKCCLRIGATSTKICRNVCNDRYGKKENSKMIKEYDRCMEACDNYSILNVRTCQLSGDKKWGDINNNYFQCAKKYNCGNNIETNLLVPSCLKKYREEIHDCCRKSLLPTSTLDPEKHCRLSARANIGEYDETEQDLKVLKELNIKSEKKSVDNIKKYSELKSRDSCIQQYIVGIGVICFLIIITVILYSQV